MAELNVSRKNIAGLLSLNDPSLKGKIFVIPEYQRPYRWEIETCDVLWNDLRNFYEEHRDDEREYFLGSIVTCEDADRSNGIDIIDGQQRITSFLLLLRAFYYKLERQAAETPDDEEVAGLMKSIEPCIWKINPMTKKVSDRKDTHIRTLVATDDDKADFDSLLESGSVADANSQSYYKRNYDYFLSQCDDYARTHLSGWKEFCLFILERCIILPIECSDLDAALTIFGTLNNRGLPLADSDIFKAELYKTQGDKSEFAERWKDLEMTITAAGFNLNDLFRYYMFVDRARHEDVSKEIGLRSYYAGKGSKYPIFREPGFFDELSDLGAFWASVYTGETTWLNEEALKYVHCLQAYPNEYWKYPLSVFYQKYKDEPGDVFGPRAAAYLRRLTAFMFARFIESPMVNAVRQPVFNFCVDTWRNGDIDLTPYRTAPDCRERINAFNSGRLTKGLLLLNAYLFDPAQPLLRGRLDIEHIFPQRWQETNYNGWNQTDAIVHLNRLGNKVVFEKRLNIMAGNNYFGKKREKYTASHVLEVVALSRREEPDWLKEDIEERNRAMIDRLCGFFKSVLEPDEPEVVTTAVEITSGAESYTIFQVSRKVSGAVSYRVSRHVCDPAAGDIFNKVMIDRCDDYETRTQALASIDRAHFRAGALTLADDSWRQDIVDYVSLAD